MPGPTAVPLEGRARTGAYAPALRRLSPTAWLLIACRAARSVGQGALVADFSLYLHALHWSAAQMGATYMGGLAVGAGLTMLSGPLSDRVGRKPFLVGYAVTQVLAALAALITSDPRWLAPAAIIGAFGRGANGAAGPFGPVEQAWLASDLTDADLGPVYSLTAAVGYCGMAIGAVLAGLPILTQWESPGALGLHLLFLLPLLGEAVTIGLLFRTSDVWRPGKPRPQPTDDRDASRYGLLLRLMGINVLNGLAIGIIGPFMAFWFHLRFGIGVGAIAPVVALGFLLASLSSLWTGWLTRALGTAGSVVAMRLAGLVLLVLLPLAPNYTLAAACYVLRAACNRGTAGARQAVGLMLADPARRGLAASMNAVSMQVPRAIAPLLGGFLLDTGLLALPMLLAAALQALYLVLYGRTFRRFG